jgi:hypothetical protein
MYRPSFTGGFFLICHSKSPRVKPPGDADAGGTKWPPDSLSKIQAFLTKSWNMKEQNLGYEQFIHVRLDQSGFVIQ